MADGTREAKGARWSQGRRHAARRRFALLRRGRPLTLIRWALAGALFLVAAVLAAKPAAAGDEPTAATVVTSRDLPLGSVLGPSDVEVVQVPVEIRPAGAIADPGAVEGRTLAGLARQGEPMTDARLLDEATRPPGTVTVPVRLADAGIAGLLRSGNRVDVVALEGAAQPDEQLTGGAIVLTVLDGDETAAGSSGDEDDGPLVLLAVPTEAAPRVAAASLARPVTVTLR